MQEEAELFLRHAVAGEFPANQALVCFGLRLHVGVWFCGFRCLFVWRYFRFTEATGFSPAAAGLSAGWHRSPDGN